tara:strand:- start:1012 stop:2541 length:1530 start_codon:yes stop_codon:yes gene_type:complete
MKKIISVGTLAKVISKLKAKGKKIVLCHGVFDLLHIGHIKHFKEAKKLGDILVVTVTQDKYVNKGPNRPIFALNTRMESIAALKDIDYVAPNMLSNAIQLIKMLKPDIYCKGKDYKNYNLDATNQIKKEAVAIKSVGGKIIHTGTVLFSSSKIINQTNLNLSNEQKSFLNRIKKRKEFNTDNKIMSIMNSFSNLKVLVIGETILDEYVFCEALGKSGKEPILVLRDMYKERYLGGTAAIAKNLSSFCKRITLLSSIGQRSEEKRFIKNNLQKNIKTVFLNKKKSPTITKKRFIEHINKTKIFGVYSLNDQPLVPEQEKIFNNKILKYINTHDLVIVSDYGHGLISDNTAKLIVKKSKFVAVNTQLNSSNLGFHVISKYLGANLITINETEMRHELRNKTDDRASLIKILTKKLKSNYTHVTSGGVGSSIYNNTTNEIIRCPAFADKVMDKVGTGDSMLAILAISLYKKFDIKFSMFLSALVAAENIQHMANKTSVNKTNITRAVQSYLK